MLKPKCRIVGLVVSIALTSSMVASAAEFQATGVIEKTLSNDGSSWGGCMAKLSSWLGPNCGKRWVSFSCSGPGTYFSKDVAYRLFDTALMAFALGKQVTVYLDDQKKHNGYCVAHRIDVMDPTP